MVTHRVMVKAIHMPLVYNTLCSSQLVTRPLRPFDLCVTSVNKPTLVSKAYTVLPFYHVTRSRIEHDKDDGYIILLDDHSF